MNVFAQTARMGRLSTVLGPDVLHLLRMDAEEHLNTLFTYRVAALAVQDDLSFDVLIGTQNHRGEREHFWDMRPSQRRTTGKGRLTDYNFKTPDAAMETDLASGAPYVEGEIDGDDCGRILVQFHWGVDARYSMRRRISQNWAGKGWGGRIS